MSYKPFRILHPIHTVVDDGDDTKACYPHGIFGKRNRGTGTIGLLYNPGVINAPTEEEIALFEIPMLSQFVKPIPQDARGFDARASGLARSIETSIKGRADGVMEDFERKSRRKKKEAAPIWDEPIIEAMEEGEE